MRLIRFVYNVYMYELATLYMCMSSLRYFLVIYIGI